ncbi:dienelactone hydrolase family protein [Agromyces larvae]|uniref:Dienelactone hydrolase family protein n=1 Tax=Agromyces larvae TaxID=2929802 RepID=A0ABY4BUP9_9MICO|nr:alpha/beta family hydrolase [Agromyces larvae]UOE42938.1 dienelactone hydrolase family protein [Agromyces larvae]
MTDETRLTIDVDGTPVGAIAARPDGATATVVVAHGAGAGMEHPFLSGFTRALNARGLATLRFNFAYIEQGRRMPGRPPAAIAAWRAVMDRVRADAPGPVWAAGKSYGGRMASMAVAEGMPAAGLVFLGYPLHPPGRPDRLRDEHLPGLTLPMRFVQGTNDPFATPNEQLDDLVARIGPNATVDWIAGGGHSFEVKGRKRPPEDVAADLAPRVAEFVRSH